MREWLRLGPLGWRFVAAFLIVGLASIGGLLIATALELDHRDALAATAQRQGMIDRLARETGAEFARTGDWQDIDLSRPVAVAESNDAHFVAVDASDTVVIGGPVGSDFRDRAVSAPVLVDGRRVGQVYVVFYSDEAVTAPQLGASWFLAAGTIAALALGFAGLVYAAGTAALAGVFAVLLAWIDAPDGIGRSIGMAKRS